VRHAGQRLRVSIWRLNCRGRRAGIKIQHVPYPRLAAGRDRSPRKRIDASMDQHDGRRRDGAGRADAGAGDHGPGRGFRAAGRSTFAEAGVSGYAVTSCSVLPDRRASPPAHARKANSKPLRSGEPETIERLNKIGGETADEVRGFPVSRRLRQSEKVDEVVARRRDSRGAHLSGPA